jgi:ubiquinone/menaquinone biosynthesis C-methylase UbiE
MTITPTTTTTAPAQPTIAEQAPMLLGHVAGYAAHRTVAIGLRQGLVGTLADPTGCAAMSGDALATQLGLDPFYVGVWCRSALAAGICERDGDGYRLAPHMATLLLDSTSPAYVGGVFTLFEQPELFGRFEDVLASGERMWWEDTSADWIAQVSGTGGPFYSRLIPGGLDQVPGLADRLLCGCRVVDTASGSGTGLLRLASSYPECTLIGVDGDAHSVEVAAKRAADAGLQDRVSVLHQPLEELTLDEPATLVINNISMHECRDIDEVTARIKASLEPGGCFVISDFPFPDTDDGLRTVPGRVMAGIQFFEAQIDDQLLPRSAYDELLERHGFRDIGSATLTPMHALTWGFA